MQPPVKRPPKRMLALMLFLLTCGSTFIAHVYFFGGPIVEVRMDRQTGRVTRGINLGRAVQVILNGLAYSAGVMTILGAHEMGHYLQARRYGIPASLPMFIPMPFSQLGTMGAVIIQEPGSDRKSLFDIAITGPLAGLVVALPLNWWAVQHSHIAKIAPGSGGWTNPLIVEWMIAYIHHPLKPNEDIITTPFVFAGWVGIFITALNLIPIGQLDGGHILHCLLGKRAALVARALFVTAIVMIAVNLFRGRSAFVYLIPMLILIWFFGIQHPPTVNDRVPLGIGRIILGWLTLAFILVGFVPSPIYQTEAPARNAPAVRPAPPVISGEQPAGNFGGERDREPAAQTIDQQESESSGQPAATTNENP